MITKEIISRGRRRSFNIEDALTIGQHMFHVHGYEHVHLAALTHALGINPPSFYAAFGSKAEFFQRILTRYAQAALDAGHILRRDRDRVEALGDFLETAARCYAADPQARGCLALEATRGDREGEAFRAACPLVEQRRAEIRDFIMASHPAVAEPAADYVLAMMSGLSMNARLGLAEDRLVRIAQAAKAGLRAILTE